ncbi:MAG: TonB-dependent receptor [Gammaproteobacteria bacterium]|nr:TonB-dependent receptor [Gammaproteobacteria bacterium]
MSTLVASVGSAYLPAFAESPASAKGQSSAPDEEASQAIQAGTLQEVTVTADRLISTARRDQKAAINVMEVQSAQEMAKYPDFDASEALGRMPGISMAGDSGEGRFVNIRGMDANYDGATYGDVTLLNTNPYGTYFNGSGRAVEFDTIPTGAIDRMIVTKTGLPDHDAEGLGGSIELSPRSAAHLTRSFFFTGDLGGGYEAEYPNFSPFRLNVAFGGRFGGGQGFSDDGPFSFVLAASEYDDRRHFDDLEESYLDDPAYPNKAVDNYQLRHYANHRKRTGYSGDFEYTPNDRSNYYVRYAVAGYTEWANKSFLQLSGMGNGWPVNPSNPAQFSSPDPQDPNGFIAPNTTPLKYVDANNETHRNTVAEVGGSNRFGGALLEYEVAYSRATWVFPHGYNATFSAAPIALAYDNIANPNFPTFRPLNGANPADPAGYTLNSWHTQIGYAVDQQPSYKADLTLPVHLMSDSDQIKIGVKAAYRNKWAEQANINYDIVPPTPLTQLFGSSGTFTNFYGRYDIGYMPPIPSATPPALGRSAATVASDAAALAASYFNDNETVYAGYAQYTGTIKDVTVLAGVRVERTNATYGGYVVNSNTNTFTPVTRKNDYTNVFPTLQLRYQPLESLIGRLTYSTAISRPGFLQSSTATQVDYLQGTVATGNPNLKPTIGRNYDLSIEYYLPHSGIISIGAFDKQFTNFVVSRNTLGSYPGITGIARFFTFENVPSSSDRGLELDWVQNFTFLPGPLSHLGITSNLTYVKSKAPIRPGEEIALPGTARYTGNLGLLYQTKKVQLQLSGEYVGASIFGAGSSAATDVYEDARTTVDFSSRYYVIPDVSLYFNAKNLTNSPLRFYEGSSNRPIQREFYEYTLEAGVSVSF